MVDGPVSESQAGCGLFHPDRLIGLPSVNTNAYVQGNHNAPPPPPQAMQSFGAGAPQGYGFQYSACTGKRKALLIGINYFGQRGQLRGCINDVKNMSTYLNGNFGYAREDMVLLTDDQQNPMSQPTKQNILRAMHWLVKDARPNDSLFFHYSGTEVWLRNRQGERANAVQVMEGRRRTPTGMRRTDMTKSYIRWTLEWPVTSWTMKCIESWCRAFNREFASPRYSIPVIPVPPSTCHTSTPPKGSSKNPTWPRKPGRDCWALYHRTPEGIWVALRRTPWVSSKKPRAGATRTRRPNRPEPRPPTSSCGREARTRRHRKLAWARMQYVWACALTMCDRQDAQIGGQATGAMSWAFITALKKNPQQSYVQLLNSIRDELESKYTQKPQLSCSHPLSTCDKILRVLSFRFF